MLRNLTIISDRQVASLDEDGVRFQEGSLATWDEIETGRVDPAKQAQFDRLLKELGEPLYRIRQRLTVGDYAGLLAPAEEVYPRYQQRRSETAYMVMQALMWSRLAAGQREAAVEPYLRCFEYLRSGRDKGSSLPGPRRLQFDPATAISAELPPIWFDPRGAKQALPEVLTTIRQIQHPRPEGLLIYYGTLALAAGNHDEGLRILRAVRGEQRSILELRDIALAQHEVSSGSPAEAVLRLESAVDKLLSQNRPMALYWLGMAKTADTRPQVRWEGVLQLLHVPAIYGKQYPELAGAALYQSMQTLGDLNDAKGSVAVRKELLVRYANTVHAAKVKSESGSRE